MISESGLKLEAMDKEDYFRFKRMIRKWKKSIKEANASNYETVKKGWENFKKSLIDWGYSVLIKDHWAHF